MLDPGVAGRSCDDCKQYRYDDNEKVGGKLKMRFGKPERRSPGEPLPCRRCPKIPAGVAPIPANAVEWTDRDWKAFRFHQECRAVGYTDAQRADPIVRMIAGLIETTQTKIDRERSEAATMALGQLIGLLTAAR